MLSRGLVIFTDIPLTVLGLILFVLAFALIFARTFFCANSKSFHQELANIALREEDTHER